MYIYLMISAMHANQDSVSFLEKKNKTKTICTAQDTKTKHKCNHI